MDVYKDKKKKTYIKVESTIYGGGDYPTNVALIPYDSYTLAFDALKKAHMQMNGIGL